MSSLYILVVIILTFGMLVSFVGILVQTVRKKPNRKKWRNAFIAFFVVSMVCSFFNPSQDTGDSTDTQDVAVEGNDAVEEAQADDDATEAELENNVKDFLIECGFTEDEASDVQELFAECGITHINGDEIKTTGTDIDNLICYMVDIDDDRQLQFTVENRKAIYISCNWVDLYTEEDGVLCTVQDVHIAETDIPNDVKMDLVDLSIEYLDHYYPDVRYYDGWGVGRRDDVYMVQCQVSDGSILTDRWIFAYIYFEEQEDGEFVITKTNIDGWEHNYQ